jgi:RNA polymerase sigma factor (TIGR02999 family)
MRSTVESDLTQLLNDWSHGDQAALQKLNPLIYSELRRIAAGCLRGERPNHTLQPTALVHEAYVRLAGDTHLEWQSRAHFFGIAANAMRRILVEHARRQSAKKRGDGAARLSLEDIVLVSSERSSDMLDLDQALTELEAFDARKSRVIELKYFGGLTAEEISEVMGESTATVNRDLRVAQSWLHARLSKSPAGI